MIIVELVCFLVRRIVMKQRKCETLSVSLSINIKNNKQDLFKISTVCPKMRLNGEQMDMYSASQIFLLQKQIAVISHLFPLEVQKKSQCLKLCSDICNQKSKMSVWTPKKKKKNHFHLIWQLLCLSVTLRRIMSADTMRTESSFMIYESNIWAVFHLELILKTPTESV